MVNTARRWSGLVDLEGPDDTRLTGVRIHIYRPVAGGATGDWHGALLSHGDTARRLEQFVGLCTIVLANENRAQVIIRVDGSFVGVDECPIEVW